MTNLDAFTLALRRASEAHPELRLGQLIDQVSYEFDAPWCHVSDADLTEALNRFADK